MTRDLKDYILCSSTKVLCVTLTVGSQVFYQILGFFTIILQGLKRAGDVKMCPFSLVIHMKKKDQTQSFQNTSLLEFLKISL